MSQRLDSEAVTLKGEPYERTLLARYAAYPIQDGKLDIDSMSLKFNYFQKSSRGLFGNDDPFFSFFPQMAPKVAAGKSDLLSISVVPLPEAGKPSSFSGGVGRFTVVRHRWILTSRITLLQGDGKSPGFRF